MTKKAEIQWLSEPEEHNYPAARSYCGDQALKAEKTLRQMLQ